MRFGPFLGLAILLIILWVGGFVVFHVAHFLLHLLLIFAVIGGKLSFDDGLQTILIFFMKRREFKWLMVP